MGMMKWDCPRCGAKVREKSDKWGYGSPFRICPKCGEEYFDKRRREPAVQGFEPRSTNLRLYIFATAYSLVFTAIFAGHIAYTVNDRGTVSVRSALLALIGLMALVMSIVMVIRISSGAEDRCNAAAMAESEERMKSSAYVHKLMKSGYNVPVKYIEALSADKEDNLDG